jgi:hypothetical protein
MTYRADIHLCLGIYHARCDTHWIEGVKRVGVIVGATPLGDHQNAVLACHGALHGASGSVAAHEDR